MKLRPIGSVLALACCAKAAVLEPDTLRAWQAYIAAADLRMQPRLNGRLPFLWTDESPERRRHVSLGDIVFAPAVGNGSVSVANGLIHHWMGAEFIPNTTMQRVAAVLNAYDHYKDYYRPFVADSRICTSSGPQREYAVVFCYHVALGSIVIASRYSVDDFPVDAQRRYSITNTTLVQEIEGFRTADERRLPAGRGSGFLWNLHTIARYQERDGGVYLELEALALTRSIPGPLRWALVPLVRRISAASLVTALQKSRDAVVRDAEEQNKVHVTPSASSK